MIVSSIKAWAMSVLFIILSLPPSKEYAEAQREGIKGYKLSKRSIEICSEKHGQGGKETKTMLWNPFNPKYRTSLENCWLYLSKKKKKYKCLEKKIGLKVKWLEYNLSCVAWSINLKSLLLCMFRQGMWHSPISPRVVGRRNEMAFRKSQGEKTKGLLCGSHTEDFCLP